jgi:hypothetical protein
MSHWPLRQCRKIRHSIISVLPLSRNKSHNILLVRAWCLALGQLFSGYCGFPGLSFQRLLHTDHHPSSEVDTLDRTVAEVPTEPRLTQPNSTLLSSPIHIQDTTYFKQEVLGRINRLISFDATSDALDTKHTTNNSSVVACKFFADVKCSQSRCLAEIWVYAYR